MLTPVFGDAYRRAKAANTKEEFAHSKQASSAAIAWGTSFVGSALQSYGVGALINATGTLSYKGAAYLGSLIFLATAAPGVSCSPFSPPRPPFPIGGYPPRWCGAGGGLPSYAMRGRETAVFFRR